MKQTIANVYQFRDAFAEMGRKDNFSYDGLRVLWDYLENYEDETGVEVECDVIAFCVEYSEDTEEDLRRYYSIDKDEDVEEYLDGYFIGRTDEGTIVYQNY